jgi:ribosome maturation factor RimP
VQVLVDREGGVDLDGITAASERISRLLDDREVLPGPFALEVSSPGLERPLRRPDHFRGAIGELVTVKVRDHEGAIRRLRGELEHADDAGITIAAGGDAGAEHVAYDDIVQARTVFEWGAAPARGKGAKKVKT